MLILEAEIYFDKPNENPKALPNDLSTKILIRPAINFGNDLLFSGQIETDKNIEVIKRGKLYKVTIDMFTVEDEAYDAINHLVYKGSRFKLQSASRVTGKGKILDFIYCG
ncbi:hypothetical protein VQL36_11390 [Chengkuizengella sp. SCS-71B]|uniref:hypothetical protein n=1 Tax=Chengkuizengella sp. SCS-71B TaxID=3115290 RepID=UPI0032C224EF